MDKMKMMFSMEAAKVMVETEQKKHKQIILGHAICLGVCTLIFMSLYFARLSSVMNMQTRAEDAIKAVGATPNFDYVIYDTSCGGPYSDPEEAAKLVADFLADCDADCRKEGSRWSHVYASMGIITLLVCLTTICVCIGAFKPMLRCIAGCCMSCLCCAHFCTFIAVAVYRFRTQGQICALSKVWTGYASSDYKELPTDDWTMEKDGSLILALWVLQLLGCCCCCIAGVNMPKPAKMQ